MKYWGDKWWGDISGAWVLNRRSTAPDIDYFFSGSGMEW